MVPGPDGWVGYAGSCYAATGPSDGERNFVGAFASGAADLCTALGADLVLEGCVRTPFGVTLCLNIAQRYVCVVTKQK